MTAFRGKIRFLSSGNTVISTRVQFGAISGQTGGRLAHVVFLDAIAKWRKATVASSCLSARPSVRMEQIGSDWTDFLDI